MKAMVYHEYGSPDNLGLQEVDVPACQDDEVLVKVHAASVNALDWHFLTGSLSAQVRTPNASRRMSSSLPAKYLSLNGPKSSCSLRSPS